MQALGTAFETIEPGLIAQAKREDRGLGVGASNVGALH